MENKAKLVANYISIFSSLGEVVAGSSKEYYQIQLIKNFIEEYVDEILIEPVEVSSWNEEFCLVDLDNEVYTCSIHPPYSGYIDIDASDKNIVILNDLNFLDRIEKNIENKIIVIDKISDPNYIPIYAYIIKKYNPLMIIFVDNYETLRRIVVLDDVISSQKSTPLPRTPVIHVAKSIENKIIKSKRIHVLAKSILRNSYGYNVIAKFNNASDKFIYITSHHDHWFNGVTDDIIGMVLMLILFRARNIREKTRNGITLAFFTAEEGFPSQLSSFYWLVGSRNHVTTNSSKLLDEVLLVLNLDTLYRDKLMFSSSNLIARGLLKKIKVDDENIEHDSMSFDSYSFASLGIPSITLHSYREVMKAGIYHSMLDDINVIDLNFIEYVLNVVYKLIESSKMLNDGNYRNLLELGIKSIALEFETKYRPLEIVLSLYRLLKFFSEHNDDSIFHKYMNTFNRIIVTVFESKDVYKGLEAYEKISYLICDDNYVYLPTTPFFTTVDECYKNVLYNLDSLTYILLNYYSKIRGSELDD